jgi:erythronate-4-phosphate dehydrogenase
MKLIADETIPLVREYFDSECELQTRSQTDLTAANLTDVDALIVRSVTPVNQALLNGTAIKLVGTATAGHDHLDTDYLNTAGIDWFSVPGCNAPAVADYVVACLDALTNSGHVFQHKRAAIIGVGHVGRAVAHRLERLGFSLLLCDPPRADREPGFMSTDLAAIANVDLICCHTPLTTDGDYPTKHIIDDAFLSAQQNGTVVLNAGRGGVIEPKALMKHAARLIFCADVYDHESQMTVDTVAPFNIATPHIAGHAIESKARATWMLYQKFAGRFGWPQKPAIEMPVVTEPAPFDVMALSEKMKASLEGNAPQSIDVLRRLHAPRHEQSDVCPFAGT